MARILHCNQGMQKAGIMGMLDPNAILERLKGAVNPDLLDLRKERDLGDILGVLLSTTVPMVYAGLQAAAAAPGCRERLENVLEILRRGMGKTPLEN